MVLVPAESRAVAVSAAVAAVESGGATYTVEVGGARISFGDDFSAAALRRVLEVLLPPAVRVFVAIESLDMRGSFDALAGAVRSARAKTAPDSARIPTSR